MTVNSGEAREIGFLYYIPCIALHCNVVLQRYNAVLLHDGLLDDSADWCTTFFAYLCLISILHRDYIYRGSKSNNTKDSLYAAVIMAVPLGEFTWFTWWMQSCARWPPTFGPICKPSCYDLKTFYTSADEADAYMFYRCFFCFYSVFFCFFFVYHKIPDNRSRERCRRMQWWAGQSFTHDFTAVRRLR